ncbi:MAG: ribonuclease D, partial [Pseudomonadota bacterium]
MKTISKTKELAAVCDQLATETFVTVDTEFVRESTYYPQLCLIQMAGTDVEALIDPLAEDLDLAPFFALMANQDVLKVFHAARQDIEIVYHLGQIIPAPLFDTQIAAMVCGFGDSVSYQNLARELAGAQIDKSSQFTDWSARPLSKKQLTYALSDVTHLRDVYVSLAAKLEENGRTHWLAEEMNILADAKTYVTHPEDAWKRLKLRVKSKKALGIMIALAAWREREAMRRNQPRQRVLKDDAIFDIAANAPTDAKALGKLRSVSENLARSDRAKGILHA